MFSLFLGTKTVFQNSVHKHNFFFFFFLKTPKIVSKKLFSKTIKKNNTKQTLNF